jgi:DNA mismatch repair protein MutS2
MLQTAAEALEFSSLVEILKRFVASPLGAWQLEVFAGRPLHASRESAEGALAEVAEAIDLLHRAAGDVDSPNFLRFQGLQDVRPSAARLRVEGTVLEAHELHALLELLDRAEETRRRLLGEAGHHPLLAAYAGRLGEFRPVLRELSGKVLPNGELADHASPALARIRRQIEQHRKAVHRSLERFVREHYQEGTLQEDYVTIRNGRLVVPVKTTWKSRVEGVIHSTSSTGHTVFVEPVETIDLNNGLARLIEEEQQEVHRVLREMTATLRPEAASIGEAITVLGRLDLLFAKATFGRKFRGAIPSFAPPGEPRLKLLRARHPLLQDVLARGESKVTPMSLTLEQDSRVLVISGPNAGGKTIVLKTLGLFSLMAQAGLPLPADEVVLPWFDEVLADIGDAQSITESLSTFSAHVRQITRMIERAGERSLVLLDELGAATDPEEGGALGVAAVDHFRGLGAFAAVSTHLPALKTYAATTVGVQNASMGFDAETLSPNYKLAVGVPGQSAGLALAQRFGIPAPIVERARQVLGSQAQQAAAFLQHLQEQVEQL